MYFVSVPAAACDDQTGSHPDNASENTKKTDLRLVEITGLSTRDPAPITEPDPSALAARILQLHATSDTFERPNYRPPQLVGTIDEPAFEMPGVLKRDKPVNRKPALDPTPVPQPASLPDTAKPDRSGPSFRAMLVSTVVAVSAVGAAVFLFSPGSPDATADSRNVETELIVPQHTIESLIEADRSAQQTQSVNLANAPTQEQIAQAKDRIRSAFAASGPVSPNAASLASPLTEGSAAAKEQSRLNSAVQSQQSTPSPHATASLPRLASSGPVPLVVPAQPLTATNDLPATSLPPEATGIDQTAPADVAAQEAQQNADRDPAYPNSGTVLASVNLRESDDKDGTILTTIPAGTTVSYDSCGTWWCGVSYDGQTGFVGEKYLERQP